MRASDSFGKVIMFRSEAKISLRVSPGAAKSELLSFRDGVLRVKIAAPPVRGKANSELLTFLSRVLGISRDALTIIKGHTSRGKVITINGLSQEEVMRRLAARMG